MKSLITLLILCGLAGTVQAQSEERNPAASTEHFQFHSDFRMNLHDFLYGRAQDRVEDERDACLAELSEAEQQGWHAAETFYRDSMGTRHHRTDDLMASVRYILTGLEADRVSEARMAPVWAALEQATPAYRACWWPDHDERNRAWIAALMARLEVYEQSLSAQLSAYYQHPWPATMPVDVVSYASWAGANTVIRPDHMMVSSVNAGYRDWAALEMVFHEASHAVMSGSYGKTAELLNAAAQVHGERPPSSLWHAILFYTSGKTTQRLLAEEGIDYTPYMYVGGVFRQFHPVLEQHWQPYLDGETDLETAARSLIDAVLG